MIYNTTSVMQVISKVLSDLNVKEEQQRISDMIEWASEAVEKIGSVKQLDRVVSGVDGEPVLEIKGNQAKLPFGLHRLNQVAYGASINGPWVPMKVSQSSFNAWRDYSSFEDISDLSVSDTALIELVKVLYQKYAIPGNTELPEKMDYKSALEILNTNQNVRTILVNLIKSKGTNSGATPYDDSIVYSVKSGYINTNMPTGYLKLSYDKLKTDKNGYLLIPDKLSYIEAVYWYIVMKLTYPEWRSGKTRDSVYFHAMNSWNFYSKQAYAESMMPNQDEMETIKNVWNKLIPEMNSGDDFYGSISNMENIYNKNR